jgi:hypothetical protein
MAATSVFVLKLTGSGNLDPFTKALMGFLFRHLPNTSKLNSENIKEAAVYVNCSH